MLNMTLSIESIQYIDLSLVLIDYTGLNESPAVLNTCFVEWLFTCTFKKIEYLSWE